MVLQTQNGSQVGCQLLSESNIVPVDMPSSEEQLVTYNALDVGMRVTNDTYGAGIITTLLLYQPYSKCVWVHFDSYPEAEEKLVYAWDLKKITDVQN